MANATMTVSEEAAQIACEAILAIENFPAVSIAQRLACEGARGPASDQRHFAKSIMSTVDSAHGAWS
jgi:hypothetical protein